jgi:hypothetical protein
MSKASETTEQEKAELVTHIMEGAVSVTPHEYLNYALHKVKLKLSKKYRHQYQKDTVEFILARMFR